MIIVYFSLWHWVLAIVGGVLLFHTLRVLFGILGAIASAPGKLIAGTPDKIKAAFLWLVVAALFIGLPVASWVMQ